MVSDKKTGRILGYKFFKDFDELGIIQALQPIIERLISEEMPEAKTSSEKKQLKVKKVTMQIQIIFYTWVDLYLK